MPLPFLVQLNSLVAQGTAPLSVTSTTVCPNLNADLLDGQHGSYYTNYVQSRLENLVTNGSGLLNNNTNFSGLTFDPVETHGGGGSFLWTGNSASRTSDEVIPIDPEKSYDLVVWAKAGNADGSGFFTNAQYVGVVPYDADQLVITPTYFMKFTGATDTTLAVALNTGDTTITLTDGTGWAGSGAFTYQRQILWWPYTNSKGYTYPNYTYSRNSSINNAGYSTNGCWSSITGNVLTLSAPWPGPNLAAGTAVSNASSGGTYKYIVMSYVNVPNTWTRYAGQLLGLDTGRTGSNVLAPPGTAYIRLLFLANYNNPGVTATIRFSDITFSEIAHRHPGSAAYPAYAFAGDTDTGIYQNNLNSLNISCGGTLTATFGSASGLTLGAGLSFTTGNRYNLADNGSIFDTTGSIARITFSTGTNYNTRSGGAHTFQAAGTSRVIFDANGMIKFAGTANAFGTSYLDFSNAAAFNTASTIYGIIGNPYNSGAGAIIGTYMANHVAFAGTVAQSVGFQSAIRTLNAATVVTSAINFLAQSPIITAGTIGISYGLYIQRQKLASGVTTGFGVYQADANDLNFFAGFSTFQADVTLRNSTSAISINIGPSASGNNANAGTLNLFTGNGKYWHQVVRGDAHATNADWLYLFFYNGTTFTTGLSANPSCEFGIGGAPTTGVRLAVSGVLSSTSATLTASTGTAPLTITSTTLCTNLNADLLDGDHASAFAKKFSQTIGDGYAFTFNIDHNLGTKDVQVVVRRVSDDVIGTYTTSVVASTTSRVVLTFASTPSTNQYRVTVLG